VRHPQAQVELMTAEVQQRVRRRAVGDPAVGDGLEDRLDLSGPLHRPSRHWQATGEAAIEADERLRSGASESIGLSRGQSGRLLNQGGQSCSRACQRVLEMELWRGADDR